MDDINFEFVDFNIDEFLIFENTQIENQEKVPEYPQLIELEDNFAYEKTNTIGVDDILKLRNQKMSITDAAEKLNIKRSRLVKFNRDNQIIWDENNPTSIDKIRQNFDKINELVKNGISFETIAKEFDIKYNAIEHFFKFDVEKICLLRSNGNSKTEASRKLKIGKTNFHNFLKTRGLSNGWTTKYGHKTKNLKRSKYLYDDDEICRLRDEGFTRIAVAEKLEIEIAAFYKYLKKNNLNDDWSKRAKYFM